MAPTSPTADEADVVGSEAARVRVENIGGISECAVALNPGVTVLAGRNATNRTSFLTAIADVLGGPSASLKGDADAGRIELDIGGTTYTKEYSRSQGTLVSQGTQFTDRGELVELFARVLGDNPARRAVERRGDLRELIMRPVDTAQIEREIRERRRERARIDERIEEIERERERLPALEERRGSLEEEIEETAAEIEEIRETIDAYEADEGETERAEELLDELEALRQSLRETEQRIEDRESELDRLEADLAETEEAAQAATAPGDELESVVSELERLRRRKRDIEETIDSLERIVGFNEDLLAGDIDIGGLTDGTEADEDAVAAALDPSSQTLTCWTCGSEVDRNAVDDRLDDLRKVVRDRRSTAGEIEAEIADLEDRKRDLQRRRDRKREIETRRERLEEQIAFQTEDLEELREERSRLRGDLDEIEERVEETEALRESELVEAYQRLSEREYKRGQLEGERERVEDEIAEIEELDEERQRLGAQREHLAADLESLRSRIDDLEETAVEQFNTHMESMLDLLEYSNLARVWIERIQSDGRGEDAAFELHVVRETEDGTVYEGTVDNLSESEREVVGLVVALAGYLVHDVHQVVPFMLLDSLEAIDSERIAALVDYFADYVPFLLVALLPEDANAISEEYERLSADALV